MLVNRARESVGDEASSPDSRTDAFFLAGGRTGCLLIHGFTGTPHEMRFLGDSLQAHDWTVSGIRLAGHGTTLGDLELRPWQEWYASANDGLAQLAHHASRIVIVGQSMGALLALKLAVDHAAAVVSVVLLSPALVLSRRWLYWIAPLLPFLASRGGRLRFSGQGESDIADPRARAESLSYRQVPVRALYHLLRLQREVRRLLPRVRQPVLIIHSRQDHTCPLTNVAILRGGLGGPVEVQLLDDSYHVISVDVDKQRVAAAVAAFAAATAGHGDAASPDSQP